LFPDAPISELIGRRPTTDRSLGSGSANSFAHGTPRCCEPPCGRTHRLAQTAGLMSMTASSPKPSHSAFACRYLRAGQVAHHRRTRPPAAPTRLPAGHSASQPSGKRGTAAPSHARSRGNREAQSGVRSTFSPRRSDLPIGIACFPRRASSSLDRSRAIHRDRLDHALVGRIAPCAPPYRLLSSSRA